MEMDSIATGQLDVCMHGCELGDCGCMLGGMGMRACVCVCVCVHVHALMHACV